MKNIVITGHKSGLGKALFDRFDSMLGWNAIGVDLKDGFDVSSAYDVAEFCISKVDYLKVDILINCAGINFISPFEDLAEEDFDKIMGVNAKGIFLVTKQLFHRLKEAQGTVVNIVSNASHMPMTHSFAYNASKAAAAMMTKQLARELTKMHGITVFGVNPNKMEGTEMSEYIDSTVPEMRGWTEEEAKQYQLNSLLTGEETKVDWIASHLVWLLEEKQRHKYLSGCLLDLGL
jgi:NAD(P)-dependent dehydrogenase (short-subunit alcohol dehydrogenase family)